MGHGRRREATRARNGAPLPGWVQSSHVAHVKAPHRPKSLRCSREEPPGGSAESNQWAGRPPLNQPIKHFQTKRGFARKTVPKRGEIDPKQPTTKSAFFLPAALARLIRHSVLLSALPPGDVCRCSSEAGPQKAPLKNARHWSAYLSLGWELRLRESEGPRECGSYEHGHFDYSS